MKRIVYLIGSILIVAACTPAKKKEKIKVSFQKNIITEDFISEGVNVGDVNNDGFIDILAGPLWFEAPEWTPHEIFPIGKYDYTKGYSDSFLNYTLDVDQDGWLDFICFDFPGREVYWYQNPGGEDKLWNKYVIDSTARNESPMLVDINEDGKMELIFGSGNNQLMAFTQPEKGSLDWQPIAIGEEGGLEGLKFTHGMGLGDVNLDGRNDIIVIDGWWEAPEGYNTYPWTFHKASLGKPCSQMYAYDFDNDGDGDVLSASAHDFGVWWHEQVGSDFVTHLIDSTFSEPHAVIFQDLNGDDLPDFVTGKRYFSHQGHGPGGMMTPYLYWFEFQRGEDNQPSWVRHQIDDNSGVGIQFVVEDINGDDKDDIIIANKKGVFFFKNTSEG